MMQQSVFSLVRELPGLVWIPVQWVLLGCLGGLAAGLTAFFVIRAAGGFHIETRYAVGLRALAGVFIVVMAVLCGAAAGFHEGTWRSARYVIRHPKVERQILPYLGESGALLIAGVYAACPSDAAPGTMCSRQALGAQVKSFAEGAWEINVPELQRRVQQAPGRAANAAIHAVARDITVQFPEVRNPALRKIIQWSAEQLAQHLISDRMPALAEGMQHSGMTGALGAIMRGLPAEAARHGDPQMISCSELSGYIARLGAEPLFVAPVRMAARHQQAAAGIVFMLVVTLPALAFRIAEVVRRRKAIS